MPDSANRVLPANQVRVTGTAAAGTGAFEASIPAGWAISAIYLEETAGHAITGGVDIGTAANGQQIVAALAVGASALLKVPDASLLLNLFSLTASQNVFVAAHTSWNNASLNVIFHLIDLN